MRFIEALPLLSSTFPVSGWAPPSFRSEVHRGHRRVSALKGIDAVAMNTSTSANQDRLAFLQSANSIVNTQTIVTNVILTFLFGERFRFSGAHALNA